MKRDITIEGEIGTNRDWKKLLAGRSQRWPNGVSRWVRADAGWGSVSCQILLSWSDSSTLFWHACQIFLLNCQSLIYMEFRKKKCTLDANSRRAVVCVRWPFDANSRRAVVNELTLKGRNAMIKTVCFWHFDFFPLNLKFVCLWLAKIYGFCCCHCLVQDRTFNLVFKQIYFLLLQMIMWEKNGKHVLFLTK